MMGIKISGNNYYLAVDQGGTKTLALVCDSVCRILGTGSDLGLATVYFNDSDGLFVKRIRAAAESACIAAGVMLSDMSAVCGCLNGADWDFEYPILTNRLREAVSIRDAIVLNDCIGGMRGGSASKDCAVVCAGSGLNAAVRRADGAEIIYGYYISEMHQGGGAIGAAAVKKVMEADIGVCERTRLTELVLSYSGYDSSRELMVDISMGKYKPQYKNFAQLLLKAYSEGDKAAEDVVSEFAAGVARYITAGARRLNMNNTPMDIVFSGSVFKDKGMPVADAIFGNIVKEAPMARLVHAKYEPVCGAALTLLDRLYGDGGPPPEFIKNFDESARRFGLFRNPSYVPR